MRIAHVVVTDRFAGTERYVVDVAAGLAARGHDVTVMGGDGAAMRSWLGDDVTWVAAPTPARAVAALVGHGRFDVVHAHLTHAEAAAALTRWRHRGRVVATRHVATRRGQSRLGGVLAPAIARSIDVEIAVSQYVAGLLPRPPDVVLPNAVGRTASAFDPSSRTVVMVQRLEPEKATEVGLIGFLSSGVADRGWRLVVAGDGSERPQLEAIVRRADATRCVTFLGHVTDVAALWRTAGVLVAPCPVEALGLTVLEAMAAGVPVLASSAGGHLETIGRVPDVPAFAPADVAGLAAQLRRLADDDAVRTQVGAAGRAVQRQQLSLDVHCDRLVDIYAGRRT